MVFISSIAALHVPGDAKPFGAMKAAVINNAKGLARALAPDGCAAYIPAQIGQSRRCKSIPFKQFTCPDRFGDSLS